MAETENRNTATVTIRVFKIEEEETPKQGAELSPSLPLAETEEEKTGNLFEAELQELRERERKTSLPSIYRVGRELGLNIKDVQEYIFGERTDAEALRELGFNRLYFRAFIEGTRIALYEQSYYYGHTKAFTGMADEEKVVVKPEIRDEYGNILQEERIDNYALIIARINRICRDGFGVEVVPAKMRKSMAKLIDCLDRIYITTGKFEGEKLCISRKFKADPKDGTLSFKIELHPIFCKGITDNYSPLPRGWIKELRLVVPRITEEHYALAGLLTMQRPEDNGKPRLLPRAIGEIVEWLRIEHEYKKDKGRTEEKILRLCKDMVKANIILSFEAEKDKKGRIIKILFTLNPNFTKEEERRKERILIAKGGINCGKSEEKGVSIAEN